MTCFNFQAPSCLGTGARFDLVGLRQAGGSLALSHVGPWRHVCQVLLAGWRLVGRSQFTCGFMLVEV